MINFPNQIFSNKTASPIIRKTTTIKGVIDEKTLC